jgi:hypothetical protein
MKRVVSQMRGQVVTEARKLVAEHYGLGDRVSRQETAGKIVMLLEEGNFTFEDPENVRLATVTSAF